MPEKVKNQFAVGYARGDFYNSGSAPIVTDLGKGQYLFSLGGSERVLDTAKMRLGDPITGVVQSPTIAKLANGTFATVTGQVDTYSGGNGVEVMRYNAKFGQIGDTIDVVDHLVPRSGVRSFSVDALSDGFVVQWIDDRIYDGKMMAQVYNTNGSTRGKVFELDSLYRDSSVPATVTELKTGNIQFNWYDQPNTTYPYFSGAKQQVFSGNGKPRGDATQTDAYRPDAEQIGPKLWVDTGIETDYPSPDWGQLQLHFSSGPYDAVTREVGIVAAFNRFASTVNGNADPSQIGTYLFGSDVAWSQKTGIIMSAWVGHEGTPASDIFYALHTAKGQEIVSGLRLNTQTDGVQDNVQLFALKDGRILATWSDKGAIIATRMDLPEKIIEGDAKDNIITGTAKNEAILGNGGDDTLDGGAGNDILRGDAGDDRLIGGTGNDVLLGNAGNDRLDGDAGSDRLDGGDGKDVLKGGKGNDGLNGGGGDDTLNGDAGADTLTGGIGDDTLNGGSGADTLAGDDGKDDLAGGTGNDELRGGAGNDWLDGQSGDDMLRGGDGNDILKGGGGTDSLYGEAGNDILRGGDGFDFLDGGDGNDKLYGDAGIDNITGGAGNDKLFGGDDADLLSGSFGRDRLDGGEGMDRLSGGDDNDRLFGGDGDDTLTGGGGNDVLRGDAGADTFSFMYATESYLQGGGRDRIVDFEAGVDRIDFGFRGLVLGDTLTLKDSAAGLVISYDAGSVVVTGQNVAGFDTGDLVL